MDDVVDLCSSSDEEEVVVTGQVRLEDEDLGQPAIFLRSMAEIMEVEVTSDEEEDQVDGGYPQPLPGRVNDDDSLVDLEMEAEVGEQVVHPLQRPKDILLACLRREAATKAAPVFPAPAPRAPVPMAIRSSGAPRMIAPVFPAPASSAPVPMAIRSSGAPRMIQVVRPLAPAPRPQRYLFNVNTGQLRPLPLIIQSPQGRPQGSALTVRHNAPGRYQPIAPRLPAPPPVPQVPVFTPTKIAQPLARCSRAPAPPPLVNAGNVKPVVVVTCKKIQDTGKQFPSLVVQVKPRLIQLPNAQQLANARKELDSKVKSALALPPSQFVEWLCSQELLKSNLRCDLHPLRKYTLDRSQSSCQYTAGFFWRAPCCPHKTLPLFTGSLFEGTPLPPGTCLKLLYHWICQTPTERVLQWCSIQQMSDDLRQFYSLLRAVCIMYLHEYSPVMGGAGRKVEVGLLTLHSKAHTPNGAEKQQRIEVLGVLDTHTRVVRMRVVNALPQQQGKGARAFQVVWALNLWVDKRSDLYVHQTVISADVLKQAGYNRVRIGETDTVMEYLRQALPQMFDKALSFLSKALIQQFLDELSWREQFGSSSLAAFDNLMGQVREVTKWNLALLQGTKQEKATLVETAVRVTLNPWLDWSISKQALRSPENCIPLSLRYEQGFREGIQLIKTKLQAPSKPPAPPKKPAAAASAKPKTSSGGGGYYDRFLTSLPRNYTLQSYYYVNSIPPSGTVLPFPAFPAPLKCLMCTRTFPWNREMVRHLYSHCTTPPQTEFRTCPLCLQTLSGGTHLNDHLRICHQLTHACACRICEVVFKEEDALIAHMWDRHVQCEAPYSCELCGFATSFRVHALQHHASAHAKEANAICPLCLQIFGVGSPAQLKLLVSHLQGHAQTSARSVKKCGRCALQFLTDVELLKHLHLHHKSHGETGNVQCYQLQGGEKQVKMGVPPPPQKTLEQEMKELVAAMPPPLPKKPKMEEKKKLISLNSPPAEALDRSVPFMTRPYPIRVPEHAHKNTCAECGHAIGTAKHFVGRLQCTRCRFATSCAQSMSLHQEHVHGPCSHEKSRRPAIKTRREPLLPSVMECLCGYQSQDPKHLAEHLVECRKYTVYPLNSNNKENREEVRSEEGTLFADERGNVKELE